VYDPQGSVQQRHTDGSYTGGYAAYDRSTFEGYGALRQANKGSTGAIVGQHDPVGFGGQFGYYTDTETGLLCLTHRYYDPGTGKFINRDPIGYQGGANLYGFCDGNPVNASDPSGWDPLITKQDLLSGLGTGWAGWSTAVWTAPGLKQLNQKYSIYSPGSYANQPGYRTSLAFGTLGRDALIAAVAQKGAGTVAARVPGGKGLTAWWSSGIDNNVPLRDWYAYEVGQKTLSAANYEQYKSISDAATRGRAIIKDQGGLRAFLPDSNGFLKLKGKGATLGTGPTPGGRFGLRTLGLAGFVAGSYYENKGVYDAGWAEINK